MILDNILGAGHPFTLLATILADQRESKARELQSILFPSKEDVLDYVSAGLAEEDQSLDPVEGLLALATETEKNVEFFKAQNQDDKERLTHEIARISTLLKKMQERDYASIKEFLREEIEERKEGLSVRLNTIRVMQKHFGKPRSGKDLKVLARADIDLLTLILRTLEAYAPD